MSDKSGEIPTCSVEEFLATSFDYIICGGGTAGCTIAARLSENPNVTVGLIEAGKNRLGDPVVDIPGMWPAQLANPDYDWGMYSEPQVWREPNESYFGQMLISFTGWKSREGSPRSSRQVSGRHQWNECYGLCEGLD